mgnify:CR=1 FL=1
MVQGAKHMKSNNAAANGGSSPQPKPQPKPKRRRKRLPRWADRLITIVIILIGVGLMTWPWILDRLEASGVFNQISTVSSTVDALSAEERERIEGAARAEQHRKDLLDCWGARIDEETLQEGRRDHTAYQWCDLGFVPIVGARWRLTRYGGNSAWYYCSPWDVRYDPDRAKELLETGPREYDRLPDGRPYDGHPWW